VRTVEAYLKKPHLVTSLVLLAAVIGFVGYRQIPVNLFPDSERPQIAVVTVYPGASPQEVESSVTRTIEQELSGLELVRRVSSVSKNEVSAVTVEFEYAKGLDSAATDVANGLQKIQATLPATIRPPMIFKVSSATPAVLTLAVRPKPDSPLDLSMARQIAENLLQDRLLQLPEVSNVEVFGAHQPVVRIAVDRDRLERFELTPLDIRRALLAFNANQPVGLLIDSERQFLLKRTGEFQNLDDVGRITVAHRGDGDVHLADVAEIGRGTLEPQSAYHGNGQAAIAVNIQRATSGHALTTIGDVAGLLPQLERDYPGLEFSIPDTQGELIKLSVGNMLDALRDAVILTVLVVFLFLADLRGMLLAAISIPFTYLLTFATMWLIGYEFNMVTLTAVIIAVGMLVDDAIVVLENIERHHREKGLDLRQAVIGGTEEVVLAIFSGTYSTVMVLLPIVFIGGFVQTVLRPLSVSLLVALLASYVVSVTVIPLLAPWVLRRKGGAERNRFERVVHRVQSFFLDPLRNAYVRLTGLALQHRWAFLAVGAVLFVLSARQMPLVGRDLMPPMDTGIVKIALETDSNTSLSETERILSRMESIIRARPEVTAVSSVVGSEPAVISFGAGRPPQHGMITVHLLDRFHREDNIWQIEAALRDEFLGIPGLKSVDVYDFGATPLSSIRAPVDVMISGPDLEELDRLGNEVARRLRDNVRGATSISRSWSLDSLEAAFSANPERLALYRISPAEVTAQLQAAVRGFPSSVFRVPNQNGLDLWVQYPAAADHVRDHTPGTPANARRSALPGAPTDLALAGGRRTRPGRTRRTRRIHDPARGRDQATQRVVRPTGPGPGAGPGPALLLFGSGIQVVGPSADDHVGNSAGTDRRRVEHVDDGHDPAGRNRGQELDSVARLHRHGPRRRRQPARCPGPVGPYPHTTDPDDRRQHRSGHATHRGRVGHRARAALTARGGGDRRTCRLDAADHGLRTDPVLAIRGSAASAAGQVRAGGARHERW